MKEHSDPVIDNATSAHKSPSYSQLGSISDPSLNTIRDQIKKVMIPMLIKIFQLKLELSQSISLPSRLQPKSKESPENISSQLKNLDEDLKLLSLWCESSRNQIAKALKVSEEEQKSTTQAIADSSAHPAVSKSFSDALSSQTTLFRDLPPLPPEKPVEKKTKKTWWQKIFS